MGLSEIIKVYLIATVTFFAIDIAWLGLIANSFYKSQLKDFLGPVNWPVAIVFYLIFIAGVTLFVLIPSLEKNSLRNALVYGAIFGFIAYSTYDLTNLSTIKNWPLLITVVDILWGTLLSASVSSITFLVAKKMF